MPAALPIALGVGAAATIYGSNKQAGAASDAAAAQTNAANQSNATQLQIFNQQRQDQAPWRQAGTNALGALSQFYGLPGLTANAGTQGPQRSGLPVSTGQKYDFNKILQSLPGYQFQAQQGNEALQRNLAAHGLLNSGAALKELDQYGQGLASQYASQYAGGLGQLAGFGNQANAMNAQAGQNYANQVGSNQIYAGNAAAAGYAGNANSWANAAGTIGGLAPQFANWYNDPARGLSPQTIGTPMRGLT